MGSKPWHLSLLSSSPKVELRVFVSLGSLLLICPNPQTRTSTSMFLPISRVSPKVLKCIIADTCEHCSLGVYQTEDMLTCEVIGLAIHYLTLCSLFWMAVTIKWVFSILSHFRRHALRIINIKLNVSVVHVLSFYDIARYWIVTI